MLEHGFKKWIQKTDTVILVCWDLGHIWSAELYGHLERRPHGAHVMLGPCQRGCGVVRARYLTSSWSPDSSKNSYKYPHHYSPREYMEGNPFFMSAEHRAAIRRELSRRIKAEGNQEVLDTGASVHDITARFSG